MKRRVLLITSDLFILLLTFGVAAAQQGYQPSVPTPPSSNTLEIPFTVPAPLAKQIPPSFIGCWEGMETIDSCWVVTGPPLGAFTPNKYRVCYLMQDQDFKITLASSNLDFDNVVWTSLPAKLFQHTTVDNIGSRVEVSEAGRDNIQLKDYYHFDEHDSVFGIFHASSYHEGVQTLDCQIWSPSLHCTIMTHESFNEYKPWTECHSHAELQRASH
jgi:hypothetical protein